jgi:hypothetical protein
MEDETVVEASKRKGRGLGKKPRLACTSLRLEASVLELYKLHYRSRMQSKMREVLSNYIQGEIHGKEAEHVGEDSQGDQGESESNDQGNRS